jgi:hypothetical protein
LAAFFFCVFKAAVPFPIGGWKPCEFERLTSGVKPPEPPTLNGTAEAVPSPKAVPKKLPNIPKGTTERHPQKYPQNRF